MADTNANVVELSSKNQFTISAATAEQRKVIISLYNSMVWPDKETAKTARATYTEMNDKGKLVEKTALVPFMKFGEGGSDVSFPSQELMDWGTEQLSKRGFWEPKR